MFIIWRIEGSRILLVSSRQLVTPRHLPTSRLCPPDIWWPSDIKVVLKDTLHTMLWKAASEDEYLPAGQSTLDFTPQTADSPWMANKTSCEVNSTDKWTWPKSTFLWKEKKKTAQTQRTTKKHSFHYLTQGKIRWKLANSGIQKCKNLRFKLPC